MVTTLTAAAFATERIGLGTAVTNLATRHPSVVASAARSVAELAPGRFTLASAWATAPSPRSVCGRPARRNCARG
ncbi:LLM class flavin-dependent oxidoreductase [Streptomyces sp. NPDC050549]|uniref:LLM class flavin-dependent oxidoreductase n=1 Tax=Streptomyces sp. NPDC050549 TaxID=3155406 RepID=UPI00341428CC